MSEREAQGRLDALVRGCVWWVGGCRSGRYSGISSFLCQHYLGDLSEEVVSFLRGGSSCLEQSLVSHYLK